MKPSSASLSTGQTALLAFSVGAIVANIYYVQPLLSQIATEFHTSPSGAGLIAMVTQLGTATGMLCFVPLGDTKERRGLVVGLLLAAALSLVLAATAHSLLVLAIASLLIGLTAAAVHVLVPLAAHLAAPEKRGSVVGVVLSGLLFGILLARTVSGYVATWAGWRSVYWMASVIMLLLTGLIVVGVPKSPPDIRLSWVSLVRSAGRLVLEQPILREAAMLGALLFFAFSAFWTTLVFFLQTPPYHYGVAAAGSFGLVGVVGALFAPLVGRIADRYGARRNVIFAILLTLFSFLFMGLFGKHLAGLIAGVILLDLGVQSGHVSNQTRIYAILPEARSRMNMVYMVCYFVAGAIGSLLGSRIWQRHGWTGVCSLGVAAMLINCGLFVFWPGTSRVTPQDRLQSVSPS